MYETRAIGGNKTIPEGSGNSALMDLQCPMMFHEGRRKGDDYLMTSGKGCCCFRPSKKKKEGGKKDGCYAFQKRKAGHVCRTGPRLTYPGGT